MTDRMYLEREAAFVKTFRCLKSRIKLFANLPRSGIDRMALGAKLREIGKGEGSNFDRSQAS